MRPLPYLVWPRYLFTLAFCKLEEFWDGGHVMHLALALPCLTLLLVFLALPLVLDLAWWAVQVVGVFCLRKARRSRGGHKTRKLKLATWNLAWHRGQRDHNFLKQCRVLTSINADVVALQEVWLLDEPGTNALYTDHHRAYLKGNRNRYAKTASDVGRKIGLSHAVGFNGSVHPMASTVLCSRYPIVEVDRLSFRTSRFLQRRCALVCALRHPDLGRVWVVCVHLLHDVTGCETSSQFAEVVSAISGLEGAVFILGDLNTPRVGTPGFFLTSELQSAGILDVVETSGCRMNTFPSCWPIMRLDHILLRRGQRKGPDLTVAECRVYSSMASDHLPLSCTINF